MRKQLIVLVEGKTEVNALPGLIRRIVGVEDVGELQITTHRVYRNRIVKPDELKRRIRLAYQSSRQPCALLLLLDSDDDDPIALETTLQQELRSNWHYPCSVVAAVREFEAWFLSAKESLRDVCGIRPNAVSPPNIETIRDAKRELERNMDDLRNYSGVDDAPRFAARLDIDAACQNGPSFRRFCSEIKRLLSEVGDVS